jgi:hypothetical protein
MCYTSGVMLISAYLTCIDTAMTHDNLIEFGVNCVYYDLSFNIIPVNSVDLI